MREARADEQRDALAGRHLSREVQGRQQQQQQIGSLAARAVQTEWGLLSSTDETQLAQQQSVLFTTGKHRGADPREQQHTGSSGSVQLLLISPVFTSNKRLQLLRIHQQHAPVG